MMTIDDEGEGGVRALMTSSRKNNFVPLNYAKVFSFFAVKIVC